jgi:hypothetical protein
MHQLWYLQNLVSARGQRNSKVTSAASSRYVAYNISMSHTLFLQQLLVQ